MFHQAHFKVPVHWLGFAGLSFNSLFLFATLALWALKDFKNSIQILILIHLLAWITATLFSMTGIYLHPNLWVGSDLITVYLILMAPYPV